MEPFNESKLELIRNEAVSFITALKYVQSNNLKKSFFVKKTVQQESLEEEDDTGLIKESKKEQ